MFPMPDTVESWDIEIRISQMVINGVSLNKSRIFLGSNLCLTLNINIAIS